jgi:hypothetical protein
MNRAEFLHFVKRNLCNNPVCVEIGVHKGNFSKMIYDILDPSILYLIDPWEVGSDKNSPTKQYSGVLDGLNTAYSNNDEMIEVQSKFEKEINKNKVIIKKGFSYDRVVDFSDQYFDFIYIDATHFYESVKADLNMYYPKLKKNGLMCGHDYANYSNFSVIPAVDEFILEKNAKMIALSHEWDFCIAFDK